MPFTRVPHDAMRDGLPGAKAGVTHLGKHPVQIIQEQVRPSRSPDARRAPPTLREEPTLTQRTRPAFLPSLRPFPPRPPTPPLSFLRSQGPAAAVMERRQMLANTYGIAMPARMDIEAQILAKQRRLPGLPSSRFGLDILTGDVDRFGFDAYLDRPADRSDTAVSVDVHAAMERKIGLNKMPGYGPGARR